MKNKLKWSFAGVVAMASSMAMAQNITVIVNGNNVNFPGQQPVMSGGRVLVPLRGVLERMGAHVDWDPETQTVSAHRDGTDVQLHIGENTASVNHRPVDLDVPAQIINGSTMVPLRFVGEALGENVHWDDQSSTVDIENGGDYNIPHRDHDHDHDRDHQGPPPPIAPPPPPVPILPAGTVIPVTLDTILDSDENRKGDTFTATVVNTPNLPRGTEIEGVVVGARPRHDDEPGMLELRFTSIDIYNGPHFPIDGRLIGLDDKAVEHRHGVLYAKLDDSHNQGAFAGYGAGAGLIIGLGTHRPIEDTAIGGLLGLLAGSIDRSHPSNVHLKPGTSFGVHLTQDARLGR